MSHATYYLATCLPKAPWLLLLLISLGSPDNDRKTPRSETYQLTDVQLGASLGDT